MSTMLAPADAEKFLETLSKEHRDLLKSPEFEKECAETFASLDGNKNGVLDGDELRAAVVYAVPAEFRESASLATEAQMKEWLLGFDANADGVFQQDEFFKFCRYILAMQVQDYFSKPKVRPKVTDLPADEGVFQKKESAVTLEEFDKEMDQVEGMGEGEKMAAFQMFMQYDKDKSRTMCAAELRSLLADLGEEYSEEEMGPFLKELDANNSGVIELGEFLRWWKKQSAAVDDLPM